MQTACHLQVRAGLSLVDLSQDSVLPQIPLGPRPCSSAPSLSSQALGVWGIWGGGQGLLFTQGPLPPAWKRPALSQLGSSGQPPSTPPVPSPGGSSPQPGLEDGCRPGTSSHRRCWSPRCPPPCCPHPMASLSFRISSPPHPLHHRQTHWTPGMQPAATEPSSFGPPDPASLSWEPAAPPGPYQRVWEQKAGGTGPGRRTHGPFRFYTHSAKSC